MVKSYERVEPTPFDAPAAPSPGATSSASANEGPPRWLWPALGILALLALAVVFVLPGWVSDNARRSVAAPAANEGGAGNAQNPASAPGTANGARSEAEPASPFADAVAAKARAEAQELLAQLLEVQEVLIDRGAEDWAGEEMASIAALALAGDEQYRERAFDAAIESYQSALSAAEALEESLPERLAALVAEATAAVEALRLDPAQEALAAAIQLQPAAEAVDILRDRVAALPELAAALDSASSAEEAGDLETALAEAERAQALDNRHVLATSEVNRLRVALTQQRFNAAMSEGYAALDDKDFARAKARFDRAGALQPGSSEAAAALQELATARTVDKLNRLQQRGEALLGEEDWSSAVPVFEEALAVDASLRFAREGLAMARPRAVLDTALRKILDDPERLVDDAILREAQATLSEARAQTNPGPRLREQIAAVEKTLAVASTPIDLRLRSDGLTEVTVYKIARLGTFDERQLSLRPGRYTAVGTRRGYRDVRVEFSVAPGDNNPVYIACSDAI